MAQSEPPELTFPQPDSRTWYIDSFGHARRGHRHQGNDLMGEKGMPVVAAADGVVDWMDQHRTAGFYIVIRHEGGWSTSYMHLNNDLPGGDRGRGGAEAAYAPGIVRGVEVKAGQLIGWVGDSGNAEWTAPHTHFELAYQGVPIDPYPALTKAWAEFLSHYAMAVAEQKGLE